MRRIGWLRPLLLFAFCGLTLAHADIALLLEEPFGGFGTVYPTGHAAIYLARVCASSPAVLRRCEPGEAGVVISRYHRIAGYDWLAIPLIPYLYAVDKPEQVPPSADTKSVAALRDAYRRKYLEQVAPDGPDGKTPEGEWVQLVGSSYDRKIYGFLLETSAEQDDDFIREFNRRRNKSHFNLFFHNCADFTRVVLDFYYRGAVHRSFTADAGMTTPKQAARSIVRYSRHNPDLLFSTFVIPQVPGSIHRSKPARGILEGFIRTKKYSVPAAVLSPIVVGGLAVVYLGERRSPPGRNAPILDVAHRPEAPLFAEELEKVQEQMRDARLKYSSARRLMPILSAPGQ
ncbi:MAG: hypothetical protein ABSD88_19015 [Candidatus Korobacteraceae bacterium]|jgi:hypothetical protein